MAEDIFVDMKTFQSLKGTGCHNVYHSHTCGRIRQNPAHTNAFFSSLFVALLPTVEKGLKKGHSEQDKMKLSIVFFVASMLRCAQGMIGKFLSPVSTCGQLCIVTNVAFVLKISPFQFGFSRKTMSRQAH